MKNYLVSNIGNRAHFEIFSSIAPGAFFDLEPKQFGWKDMRNIGIDDIVYVIEKSRKINAAYQVTGIFEGVLLKEDPVWGQKIASPTGGRTRVLFGRVVEELDVDYADFVLEKNIVNSRINPVTRKMYPGFNCASF